MFKKQIVRIFLICSAVSVLGFATLPPVYAQADSKSRLAKQIRKELVTLPWYGVFDWLEYELKPDGTVVLGGYVVRPTTKSDAENRVKELDGVTAVENRIEVLPLSPVDDRLRLSLYRTLYGMDSPLFRYATQSVPPIHIIVKNGRAILKGIVANKADADQAYIRARTVPGLFEVKNGLVTEDSLP